MTNELYHHGILGMRWGVRRYQNADGSLTAAGRRKYGISSAKTTMALGVAGLAIAGFTLSQMNNQKRSSGMTYLNQNRNNTINSVRDLVSVGSNYVNQTSNQNKATSSITNLLSVNSNNLKQQANTESPVQKLLSVGSDYVARNQKLLSTSKDTNALAIFKSESQSKVDSFMNSYNRYVRNETDLAKTFNRETDAFIKNFKYNRYTKDFYNKNVANHPDMERNLRKYAKREISDLFKYTNYSDRKTAASFNIAAELVDNYRKQGDYNGRIVDYASEIQKAFDYMTREKKVYGKGWNY